MQITVKTNAGAVYPVTINPQMELENIMVLFEIESGIPISEQEISFKGQKLMNASRTLNDYGIPEDAVLLLERKAAPVVIDRSAAQDIETMRLQILHFPEVMHYLKEKNQELAVAAQNDPELFLKLMSGTRMSPSHRVVDQSHRTHTQASNYNPSGEDGLALEGGLGLNEEEIRQKSISENLEYAIEHNPEFLIKGAMLFIPVEVNGATLKALVGCASDQTLMSRKCAEKCGLAGLIDHRYSGTATGVGTAKIYGRVHSAKIKLGNRISLDCGYVILEDDSYVDLMLGLDVLRANEACIDLGKNVLRIRGEDIAFLAEHEILDENIIVEATPPERAT